VGVGGGGEGWFDSSSEEESVEASSQESRVLGLRFGLRGGLSPAEVEVEVRVRYERVVGRSVVVSCGCFRGEEGEEMEVGPFGEDLLIVR